MALVLRRITRARWYINDNPWLPRHDLKAVSLNDLATSDNVLSVYIVEDDRANFDRIISAVSATTHYPSNFDYALIPQELLVEIGLQLRSTPGATPDEAVNKMHNDVVELTVSKLLRLAFIIRDQAERNRVQLAEVLRLGKFGLEAGHLDRNRMKEKYLEKLEEQ